MKSVQQTKVHSIIILLRKRLNPYDFMWPFPSILHTKRVQYLIRTKSIRVQSNWNHKPRVSWFCRHLVHLRRPLCKGRDTIVYRCPLSWFAMLNTIDFGFAFVPLRQMIRQLHLCRSTCQATIGQQPHYWLHKSVALFAPMLNHEPMPFVQQLVWLQL